MKVVSKIRNLRLHGRHTSEDRHRQSTQTGLPVGSVHEEAEWPQRACGPKPEVDGKPLRRAVVAAALPLAARG
jgi:hypothetical protein